MKKHLLKLKLVYLPFIILSLSFVIGYTFLHWLLLIKLQLFSIDEIYVCFGGGFVLPLLVLWIWLNPRIKLLSLVDRNSSGRKHDFYFFVAAAAIIIPTIIAQFYIETATGKLTPLNTISDLRKNDATKYYTIKDYFIDKKHIGVANDFKVTGKYNNEFNMYLYVAMPILEKEADTTNRTCIAWAGIKYSRQISNRLTQEEKEKEYNNFIEQSQGNFDARDVSKFTYLARPGYTDAHKAFKEAANNSSFISVIVNDRVILEPVNEPFESRNGNKLYWILASFFVGALTWLFMILDVELKYSVTSDGAIKEHNKKNLAEIKELFLPKQNFIITPIIIYLNIIIFLIMMFAGLGFMDFDTATLIVWGANYSPLTKNGESWRLLTSIFLHGGIMHLLANMYGLVFVGLFLEPVMGMVKYLLAYIITGLLASVASLFWHDNVASVGASGAIFGLYGIFLAFQLTKVFAERMNRAFLISTIVFIGFNLLMGLMGGIDNAAHIGGLVSGFIIGLLLSKNVKNQLVVNETEDQTE